MVKIYKIIFLLLLLAITPSISRAASLSISPSNASFTVGDLITLQVVVSSNSPINAVSSSILFPQSFFVIDSVSKAGSILNFWVVEPSFSKTTGVVNFEGVVLGGFSGTTGTIATIRLRALKSGIGKIVFQSGQVLANDGNGTDLNASLIGSTLDIMEAKPPAKVQIPTVEEEPIAPPVIEEEIPQPSPTLKAPEIHSGRKYGEPAIFGMSDYSRGQVLLTFISQDGSKIFIDGVTDTNGEFVLLVPKSLKHAQYTVSAIVIKENGENSLHSNVIVITVGNFLSDIGWQSYSLIGLLIIIIIYQFWKITHNSPKRLSKRIKREVNEATNIVHKSFDILREDLRDKKTQILKKDINDAESLINKEIKDIESL